MGSRQSLYVVLAVLTMSSAAVAAGPAAGAAPAPRYYVAIGDSISASVGARPAGAGYVNQIFLHERARFPGLQLKNFGCKNGATTKSFVTGGACLGGGSLTRVEQFLRAHRGQVAFVTIDLGGDDVLPCINDDPDPCLAQVQQYLPKILTRLKAAYPGLALYGGNYYDPLLGAWLSGSEGQEQARHSVTVADSLAKVLGGLYRNAGFKTADVKTAFRTDDFSLTGTYKGQTVPRNVAKVCAWTHYCEKQDIHANNKGHAVIAQAYETLIDAKH